MAGALAELGCERALVVSSRDGMDELSTGAVSDVVELTGGAVRAGEVDPAALGLAPGDPDALAGGGPEENAAVLRAVLAGEGGPAADVVILNAAAAVWVAGAAATLAAALPLAEASIREGAARERMEAFVAATLRLGPAA
jgi:anthranilate phosphoribosyltransferase